ncbi:hypothetical protein NQ314_020186 [Rhamnusium bicolor]|uniref:Glucosidase II subunit alpha n=1 Tax=Rhamnusium bicolor TaxID=1586634 RepID=A0AAV8WLR0_9CUCU|nr:hypothetical protein NQ314_020186 [Rhamnusium bicolor]
MLRRLRNQIIEPPSQFQARTNVFTVRDQVGLTPLVNSKNETIELQLSFLKGDVVRIKLVEVEQQQKRYELTEVLEKEPEKYIGPPFTAQFYYEDQLQVVLNGDRFVMEHLYGLYHHAYDLALRETTDGSSDPFRLRNSDTPGYEVNSVMALYGTIPVIYGHSAKRTTGIFLHNAAEQWVDIDYSSSSSPSAYFMVESGALDLFVFLGPTPKEVIRHRWSYYSQEDVKYVVARMDVHDFPLDAIWLDIDYTDEKKYFTWNPETFNDPIEMQKNLSASLRKLVTILDPHIKVDGSYPVYTGAEKDYFVKWSNGSNFEGDCWPGLSSYIDFLNPEARDYYASWYAYDKFNGSTETLAGVWNDMNEPSVFDDSLEKTLPFETLHHGGTKATHQGLMQRDNGTKRPFILTRSHFAGSQRYAAMWTGDNASEWEYLAISYAECLVSNLLGMVFCGADVGGFGGNPDEQLLQRWYQAGAWLPFYRAHATDTSERREPYLFSEDVQEVIRDAIKLRYKHIPVWYTLFYEHTRYGDPVIRPLFYHYPDILELQNHLLLGSDIMVRPVVEPDVSSVTVFFPGSETKWFRVDDDSWTVHGQNITEDISVNISTVSKGFLSELLTM